jgi:hypothetical protein
MKIVVVAVSVVAASVMSFGCKDTKNSASLPRAGSTPDIVAQNGGVYTPGLAVGGAEVPDSYTFLDTPDANLCVDAFYRKGITLPATAVARTMDAFSTHSNGVAISDIEPSPVPIMNVLHLSSNFSNVMFQLLNPNGFYCIVRNDARYSDVKIQRSCSAQIAYIEPMTTVSAGSRLGCFPPILGWFAPRGTTNAYSSSIAEMPCIP